MPSASTPRAGRVALARLLRRLRTWLQRRRTRRFLRDLALARAAVLGPEHFS